MATPSVDIMSSPDPLNDSPTTQSFFPSSQRVTRSQRTGKFMSMENTPRKQRFELEVGHGKSPQKLLVTVETENSSATAGPRRRLFASSSPASATRRRPRAVTTTVPVRDAIEEEPNGAMETTETPRRRGRPRKSNGTPMPSAAKKRKATTPARRTPRRPRTASAGVEGDAPTEPSARGTSRASRRGRPPRDLLSAPPSDAGSVVATQNTTASKRDERSRQASMPDEPVYMDDSAAVDFADTASTPDMSQPSENEMDLIRLSEDIMDTDIRVEPTPPPDVPDDAGADDESDIWMATLSNNATPKQILRTGSNTRTASSASKKGGPISSPQPSIDDDEDDDEGRGYTDLGAAASDVSSIDEPPRDTNDTIAQGEDFSMIFMESIRSLQPDAGTVELGEEDFGEETNMIINNTLESLRQEVAQEPEDSPEITRSFAAEVPAAEHTEAVSADSQPEPALQPTSLFSPSRARSPRKSNSSPLRHQVLRSTVKNAGANSAAPDAEVTPREGFLSGLSGQNDAEISDAYDDSFSEIPQNVLEAATPARPAKLLMADYDGDEEEDGDEEDHDDDRGEEVNQGHQQENNEVEEVDGVDNADAVNPQQTLASPSREGEEPDEALTQPQAAQTEEREEHDDELIQTQDNPEEQAEEDDEMDVIPAEPPAPSVASILSRSDNTRLPTPDPTPPFIETESSTAVAKAINTAPVPHATSILPQISPQIIISAQSDHEADIEDQAENGLSRVDQQATAERSNITANTTPANQMSSPVQEPASLGLDLHEKHFRPSLSPIRRAGRALQSVTSDPPSPEAVEKQLGSPFRNSVSKDSWSGSKDSQNSHSAVVPSPKQQGQTSMPLAAEALTGDLPDDPFSTSRSIGQAGFLQALNRSVHAEMTAAHSSPRGSATTSLRVSLPGDEMSWIADEGPISPNLRGDNTLQEAAASSTAITKPSMAPGQLDGAKEPFKLVEEQDESDEEQEQEDEDDETDIWEVEARREAPPSTRQQPFGKRMPNTHRRGTLPSPWTKNKARKGQDAAASQVSPEHIISTATAQATVAPSEPEESSMMSQQPTSSGARQDTESAVKAKKFDLSAFFSSPAALPGIFATKLLKSTTATGPQSSRPDPPAASAMPTSSMFPQVTQKELDPVGRRPPRLDLFSPARRRPRLDLFSPARPQQPQQPQEEQVDEISEVGEAVPSPAVQEQQRLPPVAQKQNFTPSARTSESALLQPPSGATTATGVVTVSTPPRMQLSHADIARWQQETSNASKEPANRRPLLRPLPPRNASPTKSSLRSPMKPHTPGRVVEFTSSVLSPVEQAAARMQRRFSNSTAASRPEAVTSITQQPVPQQHDGKENHHDTSDVSMTDASPLSKSPSPEPLSQTVWTRQHWLFLDALLQLRRRAPFDVEYPRHADKYLGKTVKSHGEAMRLDRWHLDCVDAFKAEVGGWDEGVLAKRLFSLILGEEKRRRGAARKPSRVMFH
ncbi:hypothetical protein S40293_10695 [Stachybotrys chartarum IBT 40293]|nr:hypothetical protein S40293_10695 [Stachybotrys chartarum IBT 40293]